MDEIKVYSNVSQKLQGISDYTEPYLIDAARTILHDYLDRSKSKPPFLFIFIEVNKIQKHVSIYVTRSVSEYLSIDKEVHPEHLYRYIIYNPAECVSLTLRPFGRANMKMIKLKEERLLDEMLSIVNYIS